VPPWRMSAPVAAKNRSAASIRLQGREGRGFDPGGVVRRQVVALLGVEHGIALEEGDFPLGLLALLVGLGAGDAIGVDDKLAGLALPDMAAEFDRLLEGQPQRAGIALGHGCRPQHDDVDTLVGDAVVAQRPDDPAGGMLGRSTASSRAARPAQDRR